MPDTPMTETPLLVGASVAFLLEHRTYPGCTMPSLTIRERLEVIEAESYADGRAEALRRVEALSFDTDRDRAAVLAAIRDTPEET